MHPVIRISIFLIFSYFLVQGHPGQLILAGIVLCGIVIFQLKTQSKSLQSIAKMLWRLRWFFLSILLLYGVLSSGDGYSSDQWLSSIGQGLLRIISLMLVVIAVVTMILSLPQAILLSALIWIIQPLAYFGLSTRTLAVRMILIINAAEHLPAMVSQLSKQQQTKASTLKSRLNFISESIIQLFKNVRSIAEQTPCESIQYQAIRSPVLYEWCYPTVCILMFILVG